MNKRENNRIKTKQIQFRLDWSSFTKKPIRYIYCTRHVEHYTFQINVDIYTPYEYFVYNNTGEMTFFFIFFSDHFFWE